MQAPSSATTEKAQTARKTLTLDEQLEQKLEALRKYEGTVRFFKTHRSLLSSSDKRTDATAALSFAKRRVYQLSKTIAVLRARIQERDARRLAGLKPKAAICTVFGDYCQE